jgi:hypothetical protein
MILVGHTREMKQCMLRILGPEFHSQETVQHLFLGTILTYLPVCREAIGFTLTLCADITHSIMDMELHQGHR